MKNRWMSYALLAVVGLAFAVIGAWLDWKWWHPTKGITITLVAIGLLLLAGVLALLRRPLTRRIAGVGLLMGVGLIAGQILGPSRPPIQASSGTMTIRLSEPGPMEATGRADCETVADRSQFQISGDPNIRLEGSGLTGDARPFISASVTGGDMWEPETGVRDDELSASLYANSAMDVADSPTEVVLVSDPTSVLSGEVTALEGALSFSGLVVQQGSGSTFIPGIDSAVGTIEWSCAEARG
jgi:hypothetical protein